MFRRQRDPRQARYLTVASFRWVIRNRAWTPFYLVRFVRLLRLRLLHPEVVTEGMVFLGRRSRVQGRRGYGRVVLGPWVHIGDETHLVAHEGTLRVGDKSVFGRFTTVNCYLDVEIGAKTLVADLVHITDFDHRTGDLLTPIKDQGIIKSPVRIGPDCWLAIKSTVLRGSAIGAGTIVAAHSVVRGEIPANSLAGGVPAKVIKSRAVDGKAAQTHGTQRGRPFGGMRGHNGHSRRRRRVSRSRYAIDM